MSTNADRITLLIFCPFEIITKNATMADEYVNLLALSAVPKAMKIHEIQIATDTDRYYSVFAQIHSRM